MLKKELVQKSIETWWCLAERISTLGWKIQHVWPKPRAQAAAQILTHTTSCATPVVGFSQVILKTNKENEFFFIREVKLSCKSRYSGKKIRLFWCVWVNIHEGLSRFSSYEDFVHNLRDITSSLHCWFYSTSSSLKKILLRFFRRVFRRSSGD